MKWIFLTLIFVILVLGCAGADQLSDEEKAKQACIKECNLALGRGQDLSVGPCLLNPVEEVPDWVCDVAHDPRSPVDSDLANQCSSYRNEFAHHFIEVKQNCEFIRAR